MKSDFIDWYLLNSCVNKLKITYILFQISHVSVFSGILLFFYVHLLIHCYNFAVLTTIHSIENKSHTFILKFILKNTINDVEIYVDSINKIQPLHKLL